MAFRYQHRSAEQWDKRANQTGGDFEGFIREEFKTFKPKKGGNAIRILPPTFDDALHYGIDVYVHYGVGPNNASVLCIQHMRNQKCPICEARMRAQQLQEDDEARSLKAAKRILAWIIDRNDEDQGPLLWAMPFTVDRQFSVLAKDRQTGEIYPIDHPDDGYDLYFDRNGEGMMVKYEGTQLARRPSSVNPKLLDFIEQNPLPDCLLWRDYAEIAALYEGGAGAAPAAPAPRSNGASNGEVRTAPTPDSAPPRRRVQAPAQPARQREAEVPRGRVEASEASQSRREEINAEVPWLDDQEEPETEAPVSAAQKLRERYRK